MDFELQMVVGSTLVLFVLLMVQGGLVPLNQGFGWGLGSRDAPQDFSAMQERARRTVGNHIEGMLLFVPLAIVVSLSDLSTELSAIGAGLYLVGRVLYAPLYLMGVAYLRSAAWAVAITGTLLIGYVAVMGWVQA